MTAFTELFPAREILDYTNGNAGIKSYAMEALFPTRKAASNDLITIVDKEVLPQIAHVHAFDTEAEKATYDQEVSTGEVFKYARKEVFDEVKMIELKEFKNAGLARYEPLADNVLQAGIRLTNAINTALELARVSILTTGKFAQTDPNGTSVTLDYKLDKSSQLKSVKFTDAEFDPIEWLVEQQQNANFDMTRGLTSVKALAAMRANPNVVKRVLGVNATMQTVMPADLDNYLLSQGLPLLRAYKGSYIDVDKAGKKTTKTFMEDGAIALFGDGALGETVFGVTAEESQLLDNKSVDQSQIGNVMISTFSTVDPITNTVLASAVAVPTLAQRYSLMNGKVL